MKNWRGFYLSQILKGGFNSYLQGKNEVKIHRNKTPREARAKNKRMKNWRGVLFVANPKGDFNSMSVVSKSERGFKIFI